MRSSLSLLCGAVVIGVAGTTANFARAEVAKPAVCGVRVFYGGDVGTVMATPAEGYRLTDSAVTLVVGRDIAVPPVANTCGVNGQATCSVLVPVQVGPMITVVDPNAEYRRLDTPSGLDSNHWILRVQRLYASLNAGPTVLVLRGGEPAKVTASAPMGPAQPIMIIPKPAAPDASKPLQAASPAAPESAAPVAAPAVEPVKPTIPMVPAAPKAEGPGKLVATAK